MWPFKKAEPGVLSDQVWLTKAAKQAAIVREVAAEVTDNARVLVVSHFTDPLAGVCAALANEGIAAERIDHRWGEPDTARLLDPDGPRVLVTTASSLSEPSPGGASQASDATSPAVFVVVLERHPLRDEDERVVGFAQALPRRVRVRFHLSLEDGLMKALGQDGMVNTMQLLGVTDGECLDSPMVSRAVATAQKKVAKLALLRGTLYPAEQSAEAWLERNLPELLLR